MLERYENYKEFQLYNSGVVASTLWNIAIAKSGAKDAKTVTPEDFIPRLAELKQTQKELENVPVQLTVEESVNWIQAINAQFGGLDLREYRQDIPSTEEDIHE